MSSVIKSSVDSMSRSRESQIKEYTKSVGTIFNRPINLLEQAVDNGKLSVVKRVVSAMKALEISIDTN